MNKQTYMIPEVGVQPLHLSACIMSGGGANNAPYHGNGEDVETHASAPKRVF